MKGFGQERSMQAVVEPVPSSSAVPTRDPLPAWDRRAWLVAIPLALIVIYAFLPCLANGFVSWDDNKSFLENPFFRGLGAAQVRWAWTTFWVGAYQPLAWMLSETQYVFWQLNPRGYHLTSLLFQVANAIVLYVLTVALLVRCKTDSCLESPWTCSLSAAMATALFMVHPLRVEAVAWASSQPYLPCILFSMLSVLAYLRAFPTDSSPRWGWLVGSFVLFLAALLFKAVAMSLPAVLLILDFYPLRRFEDGTGRWFGASARRAWLEKVPFVMTSLLFMGLASAAKPRSQFPSQHEEASLGIARACYSIWFYIAKTVWPRDLIVVYPIPSELNWLAFPFALSIVATLAVTAGLFLLRRRWPGLLATWLCYLVILAPNSGLIRISDQIAGDRYSYMSMLGLVMLAAAGFCWLWRMLSRWRPCGLVIIAMGLGALLGLTAMTRQQCRTWLNSEILWTHALAHGASSSPLAHNNLGNVLYSQGNHQMGVAHYTEALRLNPRYADAHNNLGTILYAQGKHKEAEAHYLKAAAARSRAADAHNNLAMILFDQRRYPEAEAHFTEALRLNPSYTDIHNSLGTVLARQKRYAEAEAHFTEAARLNPGLVAAHFNLGRVHAEQGKFESAAAHYAEAIRRHPGYVERTKTWATFLAGSGSTRRRWLITPRPSGSIPATWKRTTPARCSWRPVPKRSSATARGRSRSRPAPASWRSGKNHAFLIRWPRRRPRPATSTRR